MKPEDFVAAAVALYGPEWRGRTADALGVDGSTVWRMTRPGHDVSGPAAVCMRNWTLIHGLFSILPPSGPKNIFIETTGAIDLPPQDAGWDEAPTEALAAIARSLFGEDRWERKFAEAIGRNHTTLWRQIGGSTIPGAVVAAARSWQLLHHACGLLPPVSPGRPFRTGSVPDGNKRKPVSGYAALLL